MSIPTSLRNQIKKDVTACIVEEGEEPERCIIRTARMHGLTREQAQEIPGLMDIDVEE